MVSKHANMRGLFSQTKPREIIDDSYDLLALTARVHTHLPVLAERSLSAP